MPKWKTLWILAFILLIGAVLRFLGLGSSELLFDEGLYALRSIGYLDYLDAAAQPTPVEWLANQDLPWWTSLSFHDHPPLIFLIQHLSFKLFGDSLFAARLPSAIFGILSILLVYLIALRITNLNKLRIPNSFALIAAALFSISFAAVGVSRLAMMESVLFFFILLNIYFFLRFLEDKKYWFFFGASLGLAFLTKYTAIFLIPAYLIFLLAAKSPLLKSKYLYASIFAAILLFSPVIIYNIYFYSAFGHFDLQFATLLRQKTPFWQGESGKTQEPFSNILENALAIYSTPLLVAIVFGAAVSVFVQNRQNRLLLLFLLFQTLMFLPMGSAIRFISLYIISGVFAATLGFKWIWEKFGSKFAFPAVFLVFVFELMLTLNLAFFNAPDYGVVQLDKYFDLVLGEGRSAATPTHPNQHLDKIIKQYAAYFPETLPPTGIIYDENIDSGAKLWLFSRRQFYRGIPIMPAADFEEKLKNGKGAMFEGYELYFVKAGPGAPLIPARPMPYAGEVENLLLDYGKTKPDFTAKSGDGEPAFNVYKFSL
ncbi:hypothetical protein A2926_04345 [Candidatus Giovannonibacteria bacterium RIFCSPLOWO2_01_FULL_44_40]|uniref:Glycosyltransferase RgtA/B/C/D-like domain-containing protein n=1 Tax=Candidatus Giovannonibacteria bacterium RIFCSPHIGHO2_01_FULL_45_23 TaxID=1798325 RepID=A0A1F5VG25_9BACT|nr:MAG: hypothetical protein A2834_02830 [Candidatus Giovannonibacteria bacterium RIFCSPHIGHO2_01_FULL_45_23]OGF75679.1 MAG: hypothetical protein A3C77_00125 [Candidatus Giovannonibacteria bacterium RIFCSPHIGHO2_02_FULL_45_13]OGF79919.1 MAG: hypothetical protein A2926_04345 [Candidatus Giovannonibacteria bacterium RIFCSPLOWO2_01_FULL_44_40]